ncbi:MAG: hypothetical protein ACI8Y4_004058 [Candidatus Poriferisodalaceae bacterium]
MNRRRGCSPTASCGNGYQRRRTSASTARSSSWSIWGCDQVTECSHVFKALDRGALIGLTAARTDEYSNREQHSPSQRASSSQAKGGNFVLWISTEGVVTGSGAPGLDTWTDGTVLNLADPNLAFEPEGATGGTFSSEFNLDGLVLDGDANVTATHYVGTDITVGGGANTFDLLIGDLILSTVASETLVGSNGNLAVTQNDAAVYRPDVAGDYSSGEFYFFLLDGDQLSAVSELHGLTLVESDVTIGDSLVTAGDFLISEEGLFDVHHLATTGVGVGTATSGTFTKFIDGSDFNLSSTIKGIELAVNEITIAGTTIAKRTILLTMNVNDSSVGTNSLATTQQDIFALTVTKTEWDQATSVATAQLFLDGSDVSLDTANEDIHAFTFVASN